MKNDALHIPQEIKALHQKVDLCMDLMFVNNMGFLVSIDTTIRFRCAVSIPDQSTDSIYDAIDMVFRKYNGSNIKIKYIFADREFEPLIKPL